MICTFDTGGSLVRHDCAERHCLVTLPIPDERTVRDEWGADGALGVMRFGDGWLDDSWDGPVPTLPPDGPVGRDGDDRLVGVVFHHYDVDGSGLRITLFYETSGSFAPGPAFADEHADGVIVTVTERRPRRAVTVQASARPGASTVTLRDPLGDRAAWDRVRGAVRPRY